MADEVTNTATAAADTTAVSTSAVETSSVDTSIQVADTSSAQPQGLQPGEDGTAYLIRVQNERLAAKKTEGQSSPEQERAAEVIEQTAEGEQENPDEPPKGEGEEAQQETQTADETIPEEQDTFSLEPIANVPVKQMAQALKNNPELKASMEAAGIDTNALFASLRRAHKLDEIQSIIPDKETAEYVRGEAEKFGTLTQMFANQTSDLSTTRNLLGEMMKLSYQLDEDGNVKTDDQGNPVSDGTVGLFLDNTLNMTLDWWSQRAEAALKGDPQAAQMLAAKGIDPDSLHEAIQVLKGAYSGSATSPDKYEHLDAEVRAKLEAAEAREKAVADREAAEQQRKQDEFETKVGTTIDQKVNDLILNSYLANVPLSPSQKDWAVKEIKRQAEEKVANSPLFYNRLDALMRNRSQSDKVFNQRVAHGVSSMTPLLGNIVRKVVADLGVQAQQKAAATKQQVATQQAKSRSEVRSAAAMAKPTSAPTTEEVHKMAAQELADAGIDRSHMDWTQEMFKKSQEIRRRLSVG